MDGRFCPLLVAGLQCTNKENSVTLGSPYKCHSTAKSLVKAFFISYSKISKERNKAIRKAFGSWGKLKETQHIYSKIRQALYKRTAVTTIKNNNLRQ